MPDKTVVAYSWPEPRMSGEATRHLVEANRFAWLMGDVSEPSDEDGIAIF